jgi:uncharacterized small protein (DUF1192 family)
MTSSDPNRIKELEDRVAFLESELERVSRCARTFEREAVAKLKHLRASADAYVGFIEKMVDNSPFRQEKAR